MQTQTCRGPVLAIDQDEVTAFSGFLEGGAGQRMKIGGIASVYGIDVEKVGQEVLEAVIGGIRVGSGGMEPGRGGERPVVCWEAAKCAVGSSVPPGYTGLRACVWRSRRQKLPQLSGRPDSSGNQDSWKSVGMNWSSHVDPASRVGWASLRPDGFWAQGTKNVAGFRNNQLFFAALLLIAGPQDHRTMGPWDHRTMGLGGAAEMGACRKIGPVDDAFLRERTGGGCGDVAILCLCCLLLPYRIGPAMNAHGRTGMSALHITPRRGRRLPNKSARGSVRP
jgi:hypothetical protein